jgi:fumarate hydratase, class I
VDLQTLEEAIVSLYKKAATEVPKDVVDALRGAGSKESGTAKAILKQLLSNAELASSKSLPICQDTGTHIFYISCDSSWDRKLIREAVIGATRTATTAVPLRPNAVDTLAGKNTGNNVGTDYPVIYFEDSESPDLEISLLLKGGGSENLGRTYSLPDDRLGADRNLDGVRKCALDAVFQSQGKGCPPGIMSICIGGSKDRLSYLAKKQLLLPLGKRNPDKALAELEEKILSGANSLGIGPMGLGGNTALLDVKVGATARHPASYFVEICYSCWALRRAGISIRKDGAIHAI